MHIGITMFATDYAIAPHELAKEAEDRGFESMWLPEHTHIPASRKTPYPVGEPLPKEYWHTYDPFGALCAAAAVTKRIKLATGICLLMERDTIITAKETATVDRLSNGRFIFGVGGGWNVEEAENHGTAWKTRFAKLKEQVAAVRAIWSQEEAEFHGRFVNFDKIWCHPKPVQRPGPPVYVGGLSKPAIARAADYGDGYVPIDVGGGPAMMSPVFEQLHLELEQRGRKREDVPITVYGAAPKPETLGAYRELGVERVLFALRSLPREEILPRLDKYAALISG
jgi:probable F420-dependent oxidoreductase